MTDSPLTADQWGDLRQIVLDAGYANVIEGLARELERLASQGAKYAETAALLQQAQTRFRT